MSDLASAVDDYLRLITRVRPWTKRAEERRLADLCRWLDGLPSGPPGLNELPASGAVARYLNAAGADADERAGMVSTLGNFYRWAVANEMTRENP